MDPRSFLLISGPCTPQPMTRKRTCYKSVRPSVSQSVPVELREDSTCLTPDEQHAWLLSASRIRSCRPVCLFANPCYRISFITCDDVATQCHAMLIQSLAGDNKTQYTKAQGDSQHHQSYFLERQCSCHTSLDLVLIHQGHPIPSPYSILVTQSRISMLNMLETVLTLASIVRTPPTRIRYTQASGRGQGRLMRTRLTH